MQFVYILEEKVTFAIKVKIASQRHYTSSFVPPTHTPYYIGSKAYAYSKKKYEFGFLLQLTY